jgi:PAS domain S-box-containing protein
MNPLFKQFLSLRQLEYLALNRDLTILEASSEVKKFADCPHEVEQGKNICLSFPEIIGIEDILIAILEEQQKSFELKGIGRSSGLGKPLYIDLQACKIKQKESDNQLIILLEDVTERMVLEQKLVQRSNEVSLLLEAWDSSNEYLDLILQSLADALLITTQTGLIKLVNQAAHQLFGYKKEELMGKNISDIIVDYHALLKASQQYLASQEVVRDVSVVGLTQTGNSIAIAFSCSAFQTSPENLPEFVYIGWETSPSSTISS